MLSIVLFLTACGNQSDDPNVKKDLNHWSVRRFSLRNLGFRHPFAAQSDSLFAIDIKEAVQEENSNLFISLFSISSALGLLHLGANGISDEEMQSTLYMSDAEAWHAGKVY